MSSEKYGTIDSENLKLSVVITAFNRTEFLPMAIRSVFQQEGNHLRLEVIVVSNCDFPIDGIPNKINFRKIIMDGTVGDFLSEAIQSAEGDIIAFLDDDDIWTCGKIQRLLYAFSDIRVVFYHNMYTYIDSQGNPLKYTRKVEKKNSEAFKSQLIFNSASRPEQLREAIERKADFNLSCIAVRRSFALEYVDALKMITSAPDGFFFWTAAISQSDLFIDNLILTHYRVHRLNISHSRSVEDKAKELWKEIKTFELLVSLVEEREVITNLRVSIKKWLQLYYNEYMLILLTLTKNNKILILKSIASIWKTGFGIRNTLKYRITGFGLLSVFNRRLTWFLYDHLE